VGAAAGPTAYTIGSAAGQGRADERPQWTAALGGFLACRLPLTVGEWQLFQATPAGQAHRWSLQHDPDFNNPLQPVTGITWHAACAYARWADAALEDWRKAETTDGWPPLQLALPTEVHWEAAVRGPRHAAGAGTTGWVDGDPAAFNHAPTRWLRPSPVGVFSASATPLGLQDAAGNAWAWCANAVDSDSMARGWQQAADRDLAGTHAEQDARGLRALRGGAFVSTAVDCRPAVCLRNSPDVHYYVGLANQITRCHGTTFG
jgi:formylglycine-generating enzyme required for sulfatase activity